MPNTKNVSQSGLPVNTYIQTTTINKMAASQENLPLVKDQKGKEVAAQQQADAGGWIKFYSRGYQGL